MNTASTIEPEESVAPTSNIAEVRLPMGLLGFERVKDYVLITNPAEEPFQWLQAHDNASLAFSP